MVAKSSVGRVEDVPMARGRAETVCAWAIIFGVIITGATCQRRLADVRGKDYGRKKRHTVC
jgi:hypothetical protein